MKFFAVIVLALMATASNAWADGPLTATLDAQRVVADTAGGERFVSADTARPSDVVEYRTTYKNTSKRTLRQVAATLPVPAGFVFVAGSASKGALASTDGVKFSAIPLMRLVKSADGRDQMVAVPLSEYRALRWSLGDIPGESARVVTARMRMDDATVVAKR